jgi:hypothetical protein
VGVCFWEFAIFLDTWSFSPVNTREEGVQFYFAFQDTQDTCLDITNKHRDYIKLKVSSFQDTLKIFLDTRTGFIKNPIFGKRTMYRFITFL